MKHIIALDGVRGVAIIMVMIYHFTIPFQNSPDKSEAGNIIGTIFQFGWIGVDLFFVLSGFLITSILIQTRESPKYFKNFFIRRILRIFPLYFGFLILLLIILPNLSEGLAESSKVMRQESFWFWTYLVNLRVAYLGGFGSFQGGYMWSLALEEQFYLLWPLVVYLVRKKLVVLCMAIIILAAVSRIFLLENGMSPTSLYVFTLTHLDSILMGSILGALYSSNKIGSSEIYFKVLFLLGVSGFIFVLLSDNKFVYYSDYVSKTGLLSVAFIFAYFVLISITRSQDDFIFLILSNRFLRYTGKISYGLYLFHQPIGVFVERKIYNLGGWGFVESDFVPMALIVSMSASLSYIVASISYSFYEVKFLKLKKYFT